MSHLRERLIGVLTLIFIPTGFAIAADSERWILVNPQKNPHISQVQKRFTIADKTYWVVNSSTVNARSLMATYEADAVMPDFAIETIPPPESNSAEIARPVAAAWHVPYLRYPELNQKEAGQGVIVAVLDTGADMTHPALRDQWWVNTKEIPGNGVDDDGNGYVDDYNGFNFVTRTGRDLSDRVGHGTHCIGSIVAKPHAMSGAQGIAPQAKVIVLKIIGKADKSSFISDAAEAIAYAVDRGARVISNSWRIVQSWQAYQPTPENLKILSDAIRYAGQKGAVFVAGAGNDDQNLEQVTDPLYPAMFKGLSNLVVVTASDQKDQVAEFSNYGADSVHLAAPGVDIVSTFLDGTWRSMKGTSMATPLIAGTIARGLSTGLDAKTVIEHLMRSVRPLPAFTDKVMSNGVVDPFHFLESFQR